MDENKVSHIQNPFAPDCYNRSVPLTVQTTASSAGHSTIRFSGHFSGHFIGHFIGQLNGQSDDQENNSESGGPGTAVISKPKSQTASNTKTPRMYRVIIMNDDYTPMDFVILVLQKFFSKDIAEATQIMLSVHTKGSGVCGTFTFEIAETKVYQVNRFSASNHHPLKCIMEKA